MVEEREFEEGKVGKGKVGKVWGMGLFGSSY